LPLGGRPCPAERNLALVVAAGVVWFGGYNLALNAAEQLVDAGTAAMLVSVGPLLIVAPVLISDPASSRS
jgi:drug/metabolite transporter (DMT)-like permease